MASGSWCNSYGDQTLFLAGVPYTQRRVSQCYSPLKSVRICWVMSDHRHSGLDHCLLKSRADFFLWNSGVWACPCQGCAYLPVLIVKSVGSAGTLAVKLSVCSLIWQAGFQGKNYTAKQITPWSKSPIWANSSILVAQIHIQFSCWCIDRDGSQEGNRLSKPLLSEVLIHQQRTRIQLNMSYLLFLHWLYSGAGTWRDGLEEASVAPLQTIYFSSTKLDTHLLLSYPPSAPLPNDLFRENDGKDSGLEMLWVWFPGLTDGCSEPLD